MKKMIQISLLAAAVAVSVSACQKKEETQSAAAPAATATQQQGTLKTFEQKSAYAIGFSMGRYIGNTLEQQQKLGIKLDNTVLLDGVKDALNKQGKLDDKALQEVLKQYDQKIGTLAKEKAETEAKDNLAKGEAFLKKNATEDGVKVTKSGLEYKVIKLGNGPKPTKDDVVKVDYTGTLIDGTKFDSSVDRGEPATFPLGQVIPGWTEGLQLMPVGSEFKFFIPAKLAYGEHNAGMIPPNSVLIFDVKLHEIVKEKKATGKEQAKPAKEVKKAS
ncbi:FKBP-type peptidyl-prolyl cis-trans isomerase [Dongshaea marina]|uniref:FKBP-type peptidyl-prolyl cis-trans isomerase n=1 Tax=Dongshaea marina TaxID=2047966 RepID=UPI000D3EDC7F|nr:FKBP-type peptidyl-prolyl cis-trans isomerase [Dongshaea marina]